MMSAGSIGLAALVLTVAFTARADERPLEEPDAEQRVRAIVKAADSAYDQLRFVEAAAGYRNAYEQLHRVELLFNIAQAERFGQRSEAAIVSYRRFLSEAAPGHPLRAEAENSLAKLLRAPPRPVDAAQSSLERAQFVRRSAWIGTFAVLGAGLALVISGVAVGTDAIAIANRVSLDYSRELDAQGRYENGAAIALLSTGALSLLTGTVIATALGLRGPAAPAR